MTGLLQIRRAKLADELALFALVRQFPSPTVPSNEAFAQSLRMKLKDNDALVAVAELDGRLVGYIAGDAHETFYAGGKIAWVDEILVAESERRRGIGRALMTEFENWAAGGRCRLVGLATEAAASFYGELGFEPGRRLLQALSQAERPHARLGIAPSPPNLRSGPRPSRLLVAIPRRRRDAGAAGAALDLVDQSRHPLPLSGVGTRPRDVSALSAMCCGLLVSVSTHVTV